ncbi:MAG TPA: DUF2145 domain-containing protein [Burkholderiaceae bacterium]|nr:DUF2145 domain-containing protein [Burkholderiaceae bacterium]
MSRAPHGGHSLQSPARRSIAARGGNTIIDHRRSGSARGALGAVALAACAWLSPDAGAATLRVCAPPPALTATQQDKLLQFSMLIKDELARSGRGLALIARSGTDLARFGARYSHAGFALRDSTNAPWSVRQLYYDCDESRPRIFDQGLAGFLLDTDDPAIGYVSVVLLPADRSAELERLALDDRRALGLLGATYSANAYPFAQLYQNCNQWVMELLATAWGDLPDGADLRVRAQQWLKARDYEPTRFTITNPFVWIGGQFISWLHNGDHPPEDLEQMTYRVSMPASIETFVRRQHPDAQRIEFCHTDSHVLIRHGWQPIAAGCEPQPGDTMVPVD